MREHCTSASAHLSLVTRAQRGVLKHYPVTIHPLPLGGTMTRARSAFHLRELPSGGQQTSPELLRVCSSHPCGAVSLARVWFIIAPHLRPAETCSLLHGDQKIMACMD